MEYTSGYVAFIDILGFSTFVSTEDNGEKTAELFSFINKFCYLFNSSEKLKINVSFFSDSIVITAEELTSLIPPIYIAESYLQAHLGLLFRGGVAFGKYYHQNGVTFGPAVISAYQLEKKANYSRIIIDPDITTNKDTDAYFFKDIDGYTCINPFSVLLNEIEAYGADGVHYPDGDICDAIKEVLVKYRSRILESIKRYVGMSVVEKYLWRIRAFNYTCRMYAEMPCETIIYEPIGYAVDKRFKELLASQIISEEEISRMGR